MDWITLLSMIASGIAITGALFALLKKILAWYRKPSELDLFVNDVMEAVRNQDLLQLNRLRSEVTKTKYDKYRFKIAFNVAVMMLHEVIASHDKAVGLIRDANQVIEILRTEKAELIVFIREVIIFQGDQRIQLERLEEMIKRYELMFEHLNITIPHFISRLGDWLKNYEKLKGYY